MDVLLKRVKRVDAWVNHVDTADPSDYDQWLLPIAGCLLAVFCLVFIIVMCRTYCKKCSKKSQIFAVENKENKEVGRGLMRTYISQDTKYAGENACPV